MQNTNPTRGNQLIAARKLVEEKGLEALKNPHAEIGKICGCGTCFCCCALEIYLEYKQGITYKHNRTWPE